MLAFIVISAIACLLIISLSVELFFITCHLRLQTLGDVKMSNETFSMYYSIVHAVDIIQATTLAKN